jgi:hypothetical protein
VVLPYFTGLEPLDFPVLATIRIVWTLCRLRAHSNRSILHQHLHLVVFHDYQDVCVIVEAVESPRLVERRH